MRRLSGKTAAFVLMALAPIGCASEKASEDKLEAVFLELSDAAKSNDLLDPLYDVLSPASQDRFDWPDLLFILAMPDRFQGLPDFNRLFTSGRYVRTTRGPQRSEWFAVITPADATEDYRLLFVMNEAGDLRMGLAEQILHIASRHDDYSWRVGVK